MTERNFMSFPFNFPLTIGELNFMSVILAKQRFSLDYILLKTAGELYFMRLKGQCHEIFYSGFFIKELLLVPLDTPRKDFEFFRNSRSNLYL